MTAIEQTEAARPRGTRLPRRARRNQLLGAAQEVFVAQGYHAAAMDDIAERAGVSKPVLYQHFPGKLDLYLALLDQHCEALIQSVRNALASTTDNKQRVRATMDAYFAYVEDDGGAFRLVFESDLTNEPAVRERVDKVTNECAEAICDVIAEDTGLSRAESMLLASGLGGLAQVVARSWLHSDRSVPPATRRCSCWRRWPGAASRASRCTGTSSSSPTERRRGGRGVLFPSAVRSWRAGAERARPLTGLMCAGYGAEGRALTDRRRDIAVEVKIGVQHAPREIVLESGQTAEEVERAVSEALAGKSALLSLVDEHGRKVLVPADRLAYVELGEPAPRKVGFGAL
ncbi:hypothetical protein GCM10020256_25030 [Streptomyces thermocoprophilus]